MTKISFAITTHNESDSLSSLIDLLYACFDLKRHQLIILDDYSDETKTLEILERVKASGGEVIQRKFDGDFSSHKNFIKSHCTGDYIFSLDGDEMPTQMLLRNLGQILDHNAESYAVARINIVDGITDDHIEKWNWSVTSEGWINWPDWQVRIFKNCPQLNWEGHVHERISGFKEFMYLPRDKGFALYHHKDIKRQEGQNQFYSDLISTKFHQMRLEEIIEDKFPN
ncbi:MAG: glycosyltransferase [Rhabdochlamydiaceae bacterium]|nr:glycosyltransferase [Candidatus Amphrikana amoebophyrae]